MAANVLPGGQEPPNAEPPMSDRKREKLQRLIDYFDAFRQNRVDEWEEEYAAGQRQPIYSEYAVPWRRNAPRRYDLQPEGMPSLRPGVTRSRYLGWGGHAGHMHRYAEDLRRGQFGLMDKLRPLGYRLERVLGRGGFGVACLCSMRDVNGKTHTIVVKAATWPDAMLVERKNCEYKYRPAVPLPVNQ